MIPGTHPKRDGDTKVLQTVHLLFDLLPTFSGTQIDVALRFFALALGRFEDPVCKLGARVGHRQRSGPQAVFGLDDFIPAELDALSKSGNVGIGAERRFRLREDRKDGDSGVATQYGDRRSSACLRRAVGLRHEGRSTDDVEGSYSEEPVKGRVLVKRRTDRTIKAFWVLIQTPFGRFDEYRTSEGRTSWDRIRHAS